eukprot:1270560-Pleurochrysis_carterae.AAC.1
MQPTTPSTRELAPLRPRRGAVRLCFVAACHETTARPAGRAWRCAMHPGKFRANRCRALRCAARNDTAGPPPQVAGRLPGNCIWRYTVRTNCSTVLLPALLAARSLRSARARFQTMETSDTYARTVDRAAAESLGAQIATHAAASAKDSTVAFGHQVQRSNLLLNGVLLVVAGFLGLWSAFTLRLQDAIISIYVLLF